MDIIDIEIFEKFKDIAKRLYLIQKEIVDSLNLSWGVYKALSTLSIHKELTQTTLSNICGLDKPATSRLVFKMNCEKLLIKKRKNENKKNVYLSLTDAGNSLAEKIKLKFYEVQKNHFNKLNGSDKKLFLKLLNVSVKE